MMRLNTPYGVTGELEQVGDNLYRDPQTGRWLNQGASGALVDISARFDGSEDWTAISQYENGRGQEGWEGYYQNLDKYNAENAWRNFQDNDDGWDVLGQSLPLIWGGINIANLAGVLGGEAAAVTPPTSTPDLYASAAAPVTDAPVYDVLAQAPTGGGDMFPWLTDPALVQPGILPAVAGAATGAAAGSAAAGASSPLTTAAVTGGAGAAGAAALGRDDENSFDTGESQDVLMGDQADIVRDATAAGAASAATSSALARILDGTASTADWLAVGGGLGATGLGVAQSINQSNTLERIANQNRQDRAGALNLFNKYSDPTAYAEGPGKATLDAVLRRLSATHGNPVDSPTALGIATQAGMQDWRSALSGFGNLAFSGQDTQARLDTNAAGAGGGIYGALGGGLADLTTPKTSLEQLLKQLRGSSVGLA